MRTAASGRRTSPGARPGGETTPRVAPPSSTRAVTAARVCVSTRRSTVGNAAAKARHAGASTRSGKSASTQSDTAASVPPRSDAARAVSASASAHTLLAAASTASPAGVSVGVRALRSNTATPRASSSFDIAWLTADCTRRSRRAAPEKLPSCATTVSARS